MKRLKTWDYTKWCCDQCWWVLCNSIFTKCANQWAVVIARQLQDRIWTSGMRSQLMFMLEISMGWHVEIRGWKIVILASLNMQSGELWKLCFCWRILISNVWMLVRNLLLATWCTGKIESNLVSPVDAPPSFPGTLSEIRVHERHPEGRGWNEMTWNHVMFCYHVMSIATWPYPKSEICRYVFTPMLSGLRWPGQTVMGSWLPADTLWFKAFHTHLYTHSFKSADAPDRRAERAVRCFRALQEPMGSWDHRGLKTPRDVKRMADSLFLFSPFFIVTPHLMRRKILNMESVWVDEVHLQHDREPQWTTSRELCVLDKKLRVATQSVAQCQQCEHESLKVTATPPDCCC